MRALSSLTAWSRGRAYSTTEASAVTGMPLTVINHYISRELSQLGVAVWGDGKRSIGYDGLIALRMARDYPKSLAPSSRVLVIEKALKSPRKKHLALDGGKVIVRIDTARTAVSEGLRKLHQSESMVVSDASTLGGEPCFRGTRIPVYIVAGIVKAASLDEAKQTYRKLTKSQIELACFYAKAHPRRGRPKRIKDFFRDVGATSSKTISVRVD
jgi:uncharacterized protein (DUF433 family)